MSDSGGGRHQHGSGGDGAERYPVMTNRPGVEVHDPIRKIRTLALVWAAALVLACAAAAWTATWAANRSTEEHVDRVLAEMDRRAARRDAERNAALRILEQNRRTLCELLRSDDSGRSEIAKLRRAYGCGTADDPIVPPGWTPPPGWPPLPGSR